MIGVSARYFKHLLSTLLSSDLQRMASNNSVSATQDAQASADTARRFNHPFTECREWEYYLLDDDDPIDKDTPRTLIELRMCALSAAIREKPEWWVKFRDETIRAKWREETQEQQKEMHRSLQLTDNMVRGHDDVVCKERGWT